MDPFRSHLRSDPPPPVLIALYGYENRIDLSAICINPLDSSTVVGVNLPVQVTLVIDGLRKETQLESLWLFFFFFFLSMDFCRYLFYQDWSTVSLGSGP